MKTLLRPLYALLILSMLASCKPQENNYIFEVNPEEVLPPGVNKNKPKSPEQYVSILYANLFQKALSADKLSEITDVLASIGDQELARELIISNFMNDPDVIIPEMQTIRDDIDLFLEETYKRFYIREGSEAEKTWMKNFIVANPQVNPELVYFSFAMSDEYLFY